MFLLTAPSMKVIARRGWAASPTARSVTAKHWNNSFVWGRIEFTSRRAKRIRTLPRNVVREREKFRAARNTEKLDKTMIERRYSFWLRCCTSINWLCQSMSRVNGTPFIVKKKKNRDKGKNLRASAKSFCLTCQGHLCSISVVMEKGFVLRRI